MASILKNFTVTSVVKVILLLAVVNTATAQHPSPPLANIERWFDQRTGVENSGLINGVQYKMSFISAYTNPFFNGGETSGTIRFKGQIYNATVLYDCYQDAVVIKHFSSSGQAWFVQLDKKGVEEFTIGNHVFRKFNNSWHEVLFDNKDFLVVSKRSKRQNVNKGVSSYAANDEFFLVDNGKWIKFNSVSEFAKLLPSKKDKEALSSYIKANKIRKRKFSDDDLIKTATFVSSLRANTSAS